MRLVANLLLTLGLAVGAIGAVGFLLGFHVTGLTWLVAIGLSKLVLVSSGGLMAAGAAILRLSCNREKSALGPATQDG
jgi:hypothetical protein